MGPTNEYEDAIRRALMAAGRAEAERRDTSALFTRLLGLSQAQRLLFIRSIRHYQVPDLSSRLLGQIASNRVSTPRKNIELAELVLEIAEHYPASLARIARDHSAEAHAEIGNAERIRGHYAEARAAFEQVGIAYELGTLDPLIRAKMYRFEACFLVDLRRNGEAALEYRQARRIYVSLNDFHRAGRTALDVGGTLQRAGEPASAIESVQLGLLEVDTASEPHLAIVGGITLGVALADLGLSDLAIQAFRSLEPLLVRRPGDLLTIRASFAEGKILSSVGRHEEAVLSLRYALDAFEDRGQHRDAALAALDLAFSLASLGRLRELEELAQPLHILLRLEEGLSGEATALTLLVARTFSHARARRLVADEVLRLGRKLSRALSPGETRSSGL